MRDYEIVYIFRPELESEEVDDKLRGFHERLDGDVTAVEHWGTRQLAYEIAGERSGYYVVAQYHADPASLEGFEQGLKHDEELIRHLVVLAEGEMPAPPSERDSADEESGDDGGDEAEEDSGAPAGEETEEPGGEEDEEEDGGDEQPEGEDEEDGEPEGEDEEDDEDEED